MLTLSYVAVYGPDGGVGSEGLSTLHTTLEGAGTTQSAGDNNDGLFRVDLSGLVGRPVSFKQPIELVQKPAILPRRKTPPKFRGRRR